MVFWVEGVPREYPKQLRGDPLVRRVTWDDGIIRGDLPTVALVLTAARELDGLPVGPVGGSITLRDHLRTPLSALFVMCDAFLRDTITTGGDVPEPPPLPTGVIP